MIEGQRVYWDGDDDKEECGTFIRADTDGELVVRWESQEMTLSIPPKSVRAWSKLVASVSTTRTAQKRITLESGNIIALLRQAGWDVPGQASIQVKVPSGDWSGMYVDIDSSCPVVVEWNSNE